MKTDLQAAIYDLIQAAKEEGVREFLEAAQQGRTTKPAKKPRVKAAAKSAKAGGKKSKVDATPKQAKAATPKRTEAEFEAIMAALESYIRHNPGSGMEDIGRILGKPTKELALPMKKLIAEGAVRPMGEKRATKYYLTEKAPKTTNGVSRRVVVDEQEQQQAEA